MDGTRYKLEAASNSNAGMNYTLRRHDALFVRMIHFK